MIAHLLKVDSRSRPVGFRHIEGRHGILRYFTAGAENAIIAIFFRSKEEVQR
jgi:hypothetical protein